MSESMVIKQGTTGRWYMALGKAFMQQEPVITLHEGDRTVFLLSSRSAIQALKDLCEKALAQA